MSFQSKNVERMPKPQKARWGKDKQRKKVKRARKQSPKLTWAYGALEA